LPERRLAMESSRCVLGWRGYRRAWELDHSDMSIWASVLCAKCMLALYKFDLLLELLTEDTLINFFD
jgi:hypothetical protein